MASVKAGGPIVDRNSPAAAKIRQRLEEIDGLTTKMCAAIENEAELSKLAEAGVKWVNETHEDLKAIDRASADEFLMDNPDHQTRYCYLKDSLSMKSDRRFDALTSYREKLARIYEHLTR